MSRKAIAKYGGTEGCAVCTAIKRLGHLKGRLNHNHSEECRTRIVELMRGGPQYRWLMEKHVQVGAEQSVDLVTEAQREEMLGHMRKAIHSVNHEGERCAKELEKKPNKAMMDLFIANIQVAEIYSPPRVVDMAKNIGLMAGWSFDLTTPPETRMEDAGISMIKRCGIGR